MRAGFNQCRYTLNKRASVPEAFPRIAENFQGSVFGGSRHRNAITRRNLCLPIRIFARKGSSGKNLIKNVGEGNVSNRSPSLPACLYLFS